MSHAWRGANNRAWSVVRGRVLAENQRLHAGRCQLRLKGCTGQAREVHHVLGRATTGDDPRFLMATCRECNIAAGDPSAVSPPHRQVTRW